jgi:aryl-alcohol dehydrogenase-like predicted oxidoreductase
MPPIDPLFSMPAGPEVGGFAARSTGAGRQRRPAGWALGTAVLGRPAYINTGSADALPADRSVESFRDNTFQVLDAAVAAGVDWIDTARSYGRAEEFVGQWWRRRAAADPDWPAHSPTISSKWGYAYVGDWRPDAAVHEVKDHSLAQFERQQALTRQTLPRLQLYQVHSLTPDSPLFDDGPLLDALARLRDSGVAVGFSTSGPAQGETIRRALQIDRAGGRLFSSVQSTWNLLETSVGEALALASRRELTVIVKESLANGRLVTDPSTAVREIADRLGVGADAVALAAARAQPWANRILLGSADTGQLAQNLRAADITLDAADLARLTANPESPDEYWRRRAGLTWQ